MFFIREGNVCAAAIDFETANYGAESACAVSLVRIVGDTVDAEMSTLIKPPSKIFRFTHIHGIRWSDVQGSPTFGECFETINEFISDADFLVAHNAPFDRGVLRACCEYWSLDMPRQPFLCTLKGCRKKLAMKKNSLDVVCARLNIPLQHHNAASDALAAAKIFLYLQKLGANHSDMRVNG